MNRTYTPELAPEVLDRLDSYADRFRDDFNRPRQAQYSGVYLQGLILDGERKSIEPLSRKVTLPPGLAVADLDQALQQFVDQSTWDEQAVWKRYRSDHGRDLRLARRGSSSSTTPASPSRASTPSASSGSTAGPWARRPTARSPPRSTTSRPKGHYPLAMRLYLPEVWLDDAERLDKAGVPEEHRRALTKGQIALELLDQVRAEGLPGRLVVADAGYGVSGPFRDGLAAAGPALHRRRDRRDGRLHRGADVGGPGAGGPAVEGPAAGRASDPG